MTYLHERPSWPAFTWNAAALTTPLAAVRHKQGRHLGRMENLGFDLRTEASLEALTEDAIKTSAIEGEALARSEVRSSVARRLGIEAGGIATPSREVEGIVTMMMDATQEFASPLTTERLFAWHAALFPAGWSGLSRITTGTFRLPSSDPMQVVSGHVGHETVHFEAPAAARLEAEVRAFLDWFESPPPIDPVLFAGIAHFWFITLHPFEDGNGRIARAIGDMALARGDHSRERFYSLSSQIEKERKQYYTELEAAQCGDLDITPWLAWFLGVLDRALDASETTLSAVLRKHDLWKRLRAHSLHDRQSLVLNRLTTDFQGHLTTSKYARMTKCSPDTALRDIRELIDWGILVKNPGAGRSTSYRLRED